MPEDLKFYFDRQEIARFRVEAELWNDQSPQKPLSNGTLEERKSPYSLIVCPVSYAAAVCLRSQASMQQSGLGPRLWWNMENDCDI